MRRKLDEDDDEMPLAERLERDEQEQDQPELPFGHPAATYPGEDQEPPRGDGEVPHD